MKCKFKLFASKQLFYLCRYWRAHQTPDVIDWSHVNLLLAAHNACISRLNNEAVMEIIANITLSHMETGPNVKQLQKRRPIKN